MSKISWSIHIDHYAAGGGSRNTPSATLQEGNVSRKQSLTRNRSALRISDYQFEIVMNELERFGELSFYDEFTKDERLREATVVGRLISHVS